MNSSTINCATMALENRKLELEVAMEGASCLYWFYNNERERLGSKIKSAQGSKELNDNADKYEGLKVEIAFKIVAVERAIKEFSEILLDRGN